MTYVRVTMNTAAGIDDGGRGFRRGVSDIRTGNCGYWAWF